MKIYNWRTNKIIYEDNSKTIKKTVENAVDEDENILYEADLEGANLRGVDLSGANLEGAILYEANLQDADLRGANLQDEDLRGANLKGADLYRADLEGAYRPEGLKGYEIDEEGYIV